MKTDRELLELAAKASGMRISNRLSDNGLMVRTDTRNSPHKWNPLTDDGDAFRLAVKLKMDVTFHAIDVFAFPQDGSAGCSELINVDDPLAATRRAIVRAAAQIGEML